MKKLVSLVLALVLVVTCLSGLSFAADPVARVINGDKVIEVTTLVGEAEFENYISPEGTTVVELLKDVKTPEFGLWSPYTITLNMNGHTITSGRNCITIDAPGSVNSVAKIYNGVANAMGAIGIRIDGGSVEVDNVTAVGTGACAFGLYSTDGGSAVLKNSTFVSKAYYSVSFHHADADLSKSVIEIENCDLITIADSAPQVLGARTPNPGTYKLGKGVNMYTYKVDTPCTSKASYVGEEYKLVEGLQNVTVPSLNATYYDLNKWATPEYVAPAVPETPATPTVPDTTTPDVTVPATGVSVVALGVMAMVSLAGAVITKKH